MTIAAGFVHRNGVLLCSDSESSSSENKSYVSKTGHFSYPNGRIAYALAGPETSARGVIEEFKEATKNESGDARNVLKTLQETWVKEHKRRVINHPDYVTHWADIQIYLLIAIRPFGGAYTLYANHQNVIDKVDSYQVLGIGASLAQRLIDPVISAATHRLPVLHLANYVLAMCKNYVPGCSGPSQFLLLNDDGCVTAITNDPFLKKLEDYSLRYYDLSIQLLTTMTDLNVPETAFAERLTAISQILTQERSGWMKEKLANDERLIQLNRNVPLEAILKTLECKIKDP